VSAAGTLAAMLALAAAHPPRPPYPKALRCAGLIQASLRGVYDAKAAGTRERFNAGIYWIFSSVDGAPAQKRSPAQWKEDQREATAAAGAQLDANEAAALAELDACVKATPPRGN
jgi:hypothetical protein